MKKCKKKQLLSRRSGCKMAVKNLKKNVISDVCFKKHRYANVACNGKNKKL